MSIRNAGLVSFIVEGLVGKRGLTRVLVNTVLRRGKSEMPWSRMAMEESSREREERREETEAASDADAD